MRTFHIFFCICTGRTCADRDLRSRGMREGYGLSWFIGAAIVMLSFGSLRRHEGSLWTGKSMRVSHQQSRRGGEAVVLYHRGSRIAEQFPAYFHARLWLPLRLRGHPETKKGFSSGSRGVCRSLRLADDDAFRFSTTVTCKVAHSCHRSEEAHV